MQSRLHGLGNTWHINNNHKTANTVSHQNSQLISATIFVQHRSHVYEEISYHDLQIFIYVVATTLKNIFVWVCSFTVLCTVSIATTKCFIGLRTVSHTARSFIVLE